MRSCYPDFTVGRRKAVALVEGDETGAVPGDEIEVNGFDDVELFLAEHDTELCTGWNRRVSGEWGSRSSCVNLERKTCRDRPFAEIEKIWPSKGSQKVFPSWDRRDEAQDKVQSMWTGGSLGPRMPPKSVPVHLQDHRRLPHHNQSLESKKVVQDMWLLRSRCLRHNRNSWLRWDVNWPWYNGCNNKRTTNQPLRINRHTMSPPRYFWLAAQALQFWILDVVRQS